MITNTNSTDKKHSFRYFILSVIIPILGIFIVFIYSYNYVNEERKITQYNLEGLSEINSIQNIIFKIQKLRGLSNIANPSTDTKKDILKVKKDILNSISILKDNLKYTTFNKDMKQKIINFLDKISLYVTTKHNFKDLSKLVQDSFIIIKNISYHSKLILAYDVKSHILIENVISLLPEVIEYNGQIRGITASRINNQLSTNLKNTISTELSKEKERMSRLTFNMNLYCEDKKDTKIHKSYTDVIDAQHSLNKFTKNNILNGDAILLSPIDIFKIHTKNIDIISQLYYISSKELYSILNQRVQDKTLILYWIIFISLLSVFFIIYINMLFYFKNKKVIEKIQELSITDSMTELYNRRYFDIEFPKQLRLKKRLHQNLIFIMMDIDHFKQYNDTYGHQAGDKALIAVAKSLKGNLNRPDDMVFRLGGEEFGVVCSDMDKDKAMAFANKLRIDIENLNIEHKKNSASAFVTVSMGLKVIKPDVDGYTMSSIYKMTDEALYRAKQNGRNQVVSVD